MLSIRMKRLGRKGHPTYRVVVQDSRQSPTSGKYVALLGSYDPHTKQTSLVKDKAEFYLKNGAQPSDRVVALFREEKISLPKWVKEPAKKSKSLKNPDKLRKNRPAEAPAEEDNATSEGDGQEEAPANAEGEKQPEAQAEASEQAREIADSSDAQEAKEEAQAEESDSNDGDNQEVASEESKPEEAEDENKS